MKLLISQELNKELKSQIRIKVSFICIWYSRVTHSLTQNQLDKLEIGSPSKTLNMFQIPVRSFGNLRLPNMTLMLSLWTDTIYDMSVH